MENIFRNESYNYSCSYKGSRFINCNGNNDNNYNSKKISSLYNNICITNNIDNSVTYGNKDYSYLILGISNIKSNGSTYPNYTAISGKSFNNIYSVYKVC